MEQETKQEEQLDPMFELADKLCRLREDKTRAKVAVTAVNNEITATENQISDIMLEQSLSSFAHGNKLFSIRCTPRWTAVAEFKDKLFNALLDMDRRDVLMVSPSKLPKFIKEQADLYAEEHALDECETAVDADVEDVVDDEYEADGDEETAAPTAKLPEWLGELVQCHSQIGIQVRKVSAKSLKAAERAKSAKETQKSNK